MVGIVLETLLPGPQPLQCDAADLERIARAASTAGFRSASLNQRHAATIGTDTARGILDDAGLSIRIMDIASGWDNGPAAEREDIEQQLDVLETLGAGLALACVGALKSSDLARATDGFAALCERAAKRGIRVVMEFMAPRMPPNLATAWDLLRGSGAANGGLDIDLMHWHYQKGGPDLDVLRSIPGDKIYYVQLCDAAYAKAPADDDYIAIATTARPLPGDGIADISGVLKTVRDSGADPFFAMEIYNSALLRQGPDAMARKIHEAARRLFA